MKGSSGVSIASWPLRRTCEMYSIRAGSVQVQQSSFPDLLWLMGSPGGELAEGQQCRK